MFALRGARAFTGKDKVIKMDGGYHGTHDVAEVNVHPDVEAEEMPGHVMIPGVPASAKEDVLIAPFNDLNAIEYLIETHKDTVGTVIVEPILGAGGLLYPDPGYLKGVREITERFGVVLIFDEIISFRADHGGVQNLEGVTPDMTTLGKWIGGGYPAGAFGGREDIMSIYDPTKPGFVGQGGTFNANNLTMGVGLEAMNLVTPEAIAHINKLGDRVKAGFQKALDKAGVKAQLTGYGSMIDLHWIDMVPKNAKEVELGKIRAKRLPALFHLEMLNRGVYAAPRGMYITSIPMGEAEADRCIEAFEGALGVMKPYIEEETPHLLA